jgi:hypothetical protein
MLNLNEALNVIFAAHEIDKLKETLESGAPITGSRIRSLQDTVTEAGNYSAFARYKQGPVYSWFHNFKLQVIEANEASMDPRYSPSPVRKGEDPTNSKDDVRFDKGFGEADFLCEKHRELREREARRRSDCLCGFCTDTDEDFEL